MQDLVRGLAEVEPKARLAALKAALDSGLPQLADVVVEHFSAETHAKVRAGMIHAVAKAGNRSHCNFLIRLLKDAGPDERLRAVDALAQLQDPGSYPVLVRCLAADPDRRIQDTCAHHLLKLGQKGLLELLWSMARAEHEWKRQAAILACQMFNSPLVVAILKQAVEKESGKLQEQAISALQRLSALGNTAAAAALQSPPEDDSWSALDSLIADGTAAFQGMDLAGFDETYTGGKLPRIEVGQSPFADADPQPEAPRSREAPGPPPAPVPAEAPRTVPRSAFAAAPVPGEPPAAPEPPPRPRTGTGEAPPASRPCPVCNGEVTLGAKKCPYCNELFEQSPPSARENSDARLPLNVITVMAILGNAYLLSVAVGAVVNGDRSGTPAMMLVLAAVHLGSAVQAWMGYQRGWWSWTIITVYLLVHLVMAQVWLFVIPELVILCVLLSRPVRSYCVI